jgi:hypothetical protein
MLAIHAALHPNTYTRLKAYNPRMLTGCFLTLPPQAEVNE